MESYFTLSVVGWLAPGISRVFSTGGVHEIAISLGDGLEFGYNVVI